MTLQFYFYCNYRDPSFVKLAVHLCYQVTRDTHLYLKDIEEREEGGTPAIVESIRAGMVFQLKQVRVQ